MPHLPAGGKQELLCRNQPCSRKTLFGGTGFGGTGCSGLGLLRSPTGFSEMVARLLRVRFRHELTVLGGPIQAVLFVIHLGILIGPDQAFRLRLGNFLGRWGRACRGSGFLGGLRRGGRRFCASRLCRLGGRTDRQ